ncbi:hypothetical protein GOODEAATRI_031433 [Goodea atripinnis]|uniref:Uncharacterized protein n=1 Tax=Goodea atripinnis TaxID=208336 RepID=A0ABV0NZ79_9TELE
MDLLSSSPLLSYYCHFIFRIPSPPYVRACMHPTACKAGNLSEPVYARNPPTLSMKEESRMTWRKRSRGLKRIKRRAVRWWRCGGGGGGGSESAGSGERELKRKRDPKSTSSSAR